MVPPLLTTPLHRVLIIGNAAGTTARALSVLYPGARLDGVELDPVVSELGREYLGEGAVRGLHVVAADGRAYLTTTAQRYDLIVVDAYRQTYIPFYMTTQEFFAQLRQHLEPGGGIALNVERVPGDDRLVQAIAGTAATVLPQVWVWPALRFNELVFALAAPISSEQMSKRLLNLPSDLQPLGPLVEATVRHEPPASDPLTDDHAPVEWLTDRALLAYIAAGGRLDERLLPTAPAR